MGRWRPVLVTWALAGLVFVAVAHPERCPAVDARGARSAVVAAVDWLEANQRDDGAFLYRFDRDEMRDLGGYNEVRHAGVLLSLYQAARVDPGAVDPAEAGLEWAAERLEPFRDGLALAPFPTAQTGATALLVTALVERRATLDDTGLDDTLRDLGRFLEESVNPDGSVAASVDLPGDRVERNERSAFYTGEVAWALARLHATFPDEGWDGPARRVSDYLATDRDDVERRFPPVSDHWGAYALDEIAHWPDTRLTAAEVAQAERQAGLFGLQTRFESHRTGEGVTRLTRGEPALAAGVGTLGEGLGAIVRLAAVDDRLAPHREDAEDRLECVAGLLVDRQAVAPDHLEVDGAWFRSGVTQMDDQQHAVSALLAALPLLEQGAP